ncbi:MAG: hypothetical protein IJV69_04060 [Kiritimatiellae bacterium]|nr:hypothetical protein [Kiritimatiellia bacterium]
MSNEYGFDIVSLKTYISIDVLKRIDRMAKKSGKTRSRFVSEVLAAHVAGVSLSDQDLQEIAEFIERAKLAREEKRNNSLTC